MCFITERLRQAELERLAAETPLKPTYKEEDLQKLIGYIMKMTVLYDLRDEDWNDAVKQTIADWLMEPRDLVLTIYFRADKLCAKNDFPFYPVYDLTYFLRTPDLIFNVETFHDDIVFGNFVDSIEVNMISMLEMVYAPFFFGINTWPDSK